MIITNYKKVQESSKARKQLIGTSYENILYFFISFLKNCFERDPYLYWFYCFQSYSKLEQI